MTYDLEGSLGYQLSRAARSVERGFELELRTVKLTRLQWVLLLGIGQEGLTSPSGLAGHYDLDRAVVSRGLARLVQLGYVTSEVAKGDARNRRVTITPAGRNAMVIGIEAAERNSQRLLEALRPRPRIRLMELLRDFNRAGGGSDTV